MDAVYFESVYELARYLMDYKYPTAYGFSINKANTEKQLETGKQQQLCIKYSLADTSA